MANLFILDFGTVLRCQTSALLVALLSSGSWNSSGEFPFRWHLGAPNGSTRLWPSGPVRGSFLLRAAAMAEHGGGYKTCAWSSSILASAGIQPAGCSRHVGPFGHPPNLSFVDHLHIKKEWTCPVPCFFLRGEDILKFWQKLV